MSLIDENRNREYISSLRKECKKALEENTLEGILSTLKRVLDTRALYHLHTNNSKTADHIMGVTCHISILLNYLKEGSVENKRRYVLTFVNGMVATKEPLSTERIKKCIYKSSKTESKETIKAYKNMCLLCYKRILNLSTALIDEISDHLD